MKLEKSEALGRNIRREDGPALADSTWDAVRLAIREGRAEDALAALEYACTEAQMLHDSAVSLVDDALGQLAQTAGEDAIYQMLRQRYEPFIRKWLAATPGVRESLERGIEFQRGHFGKTEVREEADKFVVTCDPCGSGGRLRRTKPVVARATESHDWTWNKPDVPLYCTHCAVMWEILPMEIRGIPIRVNLPPKQDTDPCVHLYYKTPEAIPEEYFRRVGRTRQGEAGGKSGTPSGNKQD